MSKNERSNEKRHSMVNVAKDTGKSTKGLFKKLFEDGKDTVRTITSGQKPTNKLTPWSVGSIVVAVIVILYMLYSTIANF